MKSTTSSEMSARTAVDVADVQVKAVVAADKNGGSVDLARAMFILFGCILGAAAAGIPLGVLLANRSCSTSTAIHSSSTSMNTCWKPLLEMDGRGFLFAQQHVAAFLQASTDATLVMNTMPNMSLAVATGAMYDYPAEVTTLVGKLAAVNTQAQKDEITFFDGKLNIALGIIGTLLLGYGQSIEEIIFHSFGETTSVYDSGVAVWKNKLLNSRIRPTTVIQQLYPETQYTINDGITVPGKYFQALVRVMPHSEYPSGSSCVCQAIDEYLTDLWPELTLSTAGTPVTFNAGTTPVVLPNTQMPAVPLTGAVNPLTSGYTAGSLNARCGETREEGGMHFTPAVPAGRTLCAGMGSATAAKIKTLIPGVTAGSTTVRAAIDATAPCEATCCAALDACNSTESALCTAKCEHTWALPWFDVVDTRMKAFGLPDRATATTMMAPFFQADRNHLVIVGMFGSFVPSILKSETIFQFRYTNTVDNMVWNSFAANSVDLKVFKYGQSKDAADPIVRSGKTSSDARVVTAIHATAAGLLLLLPQAEADFRASLGYGVLMPTIGFESSLVTACGATNSAATIFDANCLKSWYQLSVGPARLGQIIAYELMYYKVRDGWNSMGTDGSCNAGAHFCHRYADITGYNPENGACLKETLSA
jgi:hypothetical protein